MTTRSWLNTHPELQSKWHLHQVTQQYLKSYLRHASLITHQTEQLKQLIKMMLCGELSAWRDFIRFHNNLAIDTRLRLTNLWIEIGDAFAKHQNRPPDRVDAVLLTALRDPEFIELHRLPTYKDKPWQEFRLRDDVKTYTWGTWGVNKPIHVVAVCSDQMGMVPIAVIATRMISIFRPTFIILCGISAGLNNSKPGDLLVPSKVFVHDSGKFERLAENTTTVFHPNPWSHEIDKRILDEVHTHQSKFLEGIQDDWKKNSRSPQDVPLQMQIHTGPIAVGDSVVNSEDIIKTILGFDRKTIGVEMEGYGLLAAAKAFSQTLYAFIAKAVSDKGMDKDDNFRKYASYVSARFVQNFLTSTSLRSEIEIDKC